MANGPSHTSASETALDPKAATGSHPRVPRVGTGQRQAFAVRPWELFGFGCHYAWVLCVVFGGSLALGGVDDTWAVAQRIGMALGIAAGYVSLFAARRVAFVRTPPKWAPVAAAALMCVGTALVALPLSGAGSYVVVAVASLACGAGSAFLMICGGRFWANSQGETGLTQVAASTLAAVVLYYATLPLPAVLRATLTCLLPLGCALILTNSRNVEARTSTAELDEAFFHSPAERRLLASVAGVGVAFGCAFTFAVMHGAAETPLLFCGLPVVFVVSLVLALTNVPARFVTLGARWAVLLLLLGFLGSASGSGGLGVAGIVLVTSGFFLFDQTLWLLNSELVARSGTNAADVLPRFEGTLWSSLTLGAFAGMLLANLGIAWSPLCVGAGAVALVATTVCTPGDTAHLLSRRTELGGRPSTSARCALVAHQYGLSPREAQVLDLVAHGRSASYIQEELCIAVGTVKVHTRHIYEKCGVAGKQELINLVEHAHEKR